MNEIIRHIEFLLLTHDCVIVPGFGALLAHNEPARLDDAGMRLMPPSRTFTFNAGLTQNDGVLVTSVARAKSVSYEAARLIVDNGVEALRRSLSADGGVSLGKAGVLDMSADGVLSFRPSAIAALSPSTMWLPSLHLTEVSELARLRDEQRMRESERKGSRLSRYVSRAVRVAASLAAIVALGFVLSTPIKLDNAQYASFGIENFRTPDHVQPESKLIRRPGEQTSPLVIVFDRHADAIETVDTAAHNEYVRHAAARKAAVHTVKTAEPEQNRETVRFNSDDCYCLVVASLATKEEADEYIVKSKNNQLGILAKDGRYRVYAATAQTSRQAQETAKELAANYPDAWVCRK